MEIIIKIDDAELERRSELEQDDDREYLSMYAKWFNEKCPAWTNYSEFNREFLKQQQFHANELLKRRGYVFLNEVYDMLGIPRTKAGQVVGWVYDMTNPMGDNYIDFDIFSQRNEDFVNGYENSVLLDFNVDGMILDRI